MNLPVNIKKELIESTYIFLENKLDGIKGEVKMLDAIHKDISKLGNEWSIIINKHFPSMNVTMNSYFVHQTPKVSYHGLSKTSIEFGDILYLYSETDKKNIKRETALLLQAKVFEDKGVDKHQLQLYKDWPIFSFLNAKLGTNLNVVPSPQSHLGGRYLFLDDSAKNCKFASTGTPKKNLRANDFDNYLENELVSLLDFSRGKELIGDWEKAINAVCNYINSNNKQYKNVSRNQPIMYSLVSHLGDSNYFTPDDFIESEDEGFWFVHIQANYDKQDDYIDLC